jgi:mono/diheme cytochrome c family protein
MTKLWWFFLGMASLAVVVLAAGAVVIFSSHGFSAREEPTGIERRLAKITRTAALPADAKNRANPVSNTLEVLTEARAHWADHCAACHANDGSGESEMGKRLYPPAPDMRLAGTQRKSNGELFYIIQNGVRLTGMPAWGGSDHDEEASWKLVCFIRHLPQLTFEEKKDMEKLNPKGPEDRKEEEEEETFLKGNTDDFKGNIDEPQTPHHHH